MQKQSKVTMFIILVSETILSAGSIRLVDICKNLNYKIAILLI